MNCRKRLVQLRGSLSRIDATGARVVGVVCQKRANVEAIHAEDPFPFPLLVDEDRSIAKRWGVYHRIGLDAIHIAHPATFVVDGEGIVRLAEVAPNQFTRVSVEAVLDALTALQRSR